MVLRLLSRPPVMTLILSIISALLLVLAYRLLLATDYIILIVANLDDLLFFQIPATLAGLALATATYFVSSPLSDVRKERNSLISARADNAQSMAYLRALEQQIQHMEKSGFNLFNAFYAFLAALLVILALDSSRPVSYVDQPKWFRIVSSIAQATPTGLGLFYLLAGAESVKAFHFPEHRKRLREKT